MSNIRFRVFAKAFPDGFEMDCFVLPSDETNGEFVHYKPNYALDFRGITEPGLFVALDNLLEHIQPEIEEPTIKMVIERLKDHKRTHWSFRSAEEYPADSPEVEIWALVKSFFEKRLQEKKDEASKCPFKVGEMVKFTPSPDARKSSKIIELCGLEINEIAKIAEIRGGIYLYFEDGRGGFSWNEFSSI
jgi:hypothetical protein